MFEPELLTRANSSMRRDAEYFISECSEEICSMSGRCIDIGTGAGDVTIDFILPKLKPNSVLLCESRVYGSMGRKIEETLIRMFVHSGSDISEDMVNYGKKRYGNDDQLDFMKLDIETPNLPKNLIGQFDHLTSLYCLHWCYDLRRALENMYDLLRPGGTAFVTFLSSYRGLDTFLDLQASPKYQSYMKNAHRIIPQFQRSERPREDLMKLLKDVGFNVKLCSCRPMTWIWDTKNALTDFLLAVNPFKTDEMPADLRSEYVEDITRLFMEHEIVFNKGRNNRNEASILCSYSTFVVCIEKPSNKRYKIFPRGLGPIPNINWLRLCIPYLILRWHEDAMDSISL